jgi:glucuronoarabinoxylan endo-1,4-beta-xylanase
MKTWQTEASLIGDQCSNTTGMANGLFWAQVIHSILVNAGANGFIYWNGSVQYSDGEALYCNGVPSKRFYVLGNFSKFIRPGYHMIGADRSSTPLLVSAYKDTIGGSLVVVVINNSKNQTLTFAMNGCNASMVTPWVTSGSKNMEKQPDVQVAIHLPLLLMTAALRPLWRQQPHPLKKV